MWKAARPTHHHQRVRRARRDAIRVKSIGDIVTLKEHLTPSGADRTPFFGPPVMRARVGFLVSSGVRILLGLVVRSGTSYSEVSPVTVRVRHAERDRRRIATDTVLLRSNVSVRRWRRIQCGRTKSMWARPFEAAAPPLGLPATYSAPPARR